MKKNLPTAKPKKSRFRFIGETIEELKKVTWPPRKDALQLSIMVTVVCLAAGIVLGIIDYGFTELFSKVFLRGR